METEVNHKLPFLDVVLDNSNRAQISRHICFPQEHLHRPSQFFTFFLQIRFNTNAGGQDF